VPGGKFSSSPCKDPVYPENPKILSKLIQSPVFDISVRYHYVYIRLPEELRTKADAVLAAIGLDLPTAVRLYLTKIVQTRSSPFALESGPETVEAIAVDEEIEGRMDRVAAACDYPKS